MACDQQLCPLLDLINTLLLFTITTFDSHRLLPSLSPLSTFSLSPPSFMPELHPELLSSL